MKTRSILDCCKSYCNGRIASYCAGMMVLLAALIARPAGAITISEVERQAAWLINTERVSAGLPQLSQDADLSAIARQHSEAMRQQGFVGVRPRSAGVKSPREQYVDKTGTEPDTFLVSVSRDEDIGVSATLPQTVHTGFMQNAADKSHILDSKATMMGIGVAVDDEGTVWTTLITAKAGKPSPRDEAAGGAGTGPSVTVTAEPPSVGKPSPTISPGPGAPGLMGGPPIPGAPGTVKPGRIDITQTGKEPAPARTGVTQATGVIAEPRGVTRPVRVIIKRALVGPDEPLVVRIPVSAGDAIRWGVTGADEEGMFSVTYTAPDGVSSMTAASTDIHRCPLQSVFSNGTCKLRVESDEKAECRLIAVTGGTSAVQGYGHALRSPQLLEPGTTVTGSLGDGGSPATYEFGVPHYGAGLVRIRNLDPDCAPTCAVYAASGRLVERGQPGSDGVWTAALWDLPAGRYIAVITDLEASPGGGDFEIALTSD